MKTKLILSIVFAFVLAGCSVPPITFSAPDVDVSATKINAEVKAITVTLARPDEAKGDVEAGMEGITTLWKEALQEALDKMAIFSDTSNSKVSIQVKILAMNAPAAGLEMTTTSIARYQIIDRASGSIIYAQDITAKGVVPFSYAAYGLKRWRESINRAAQNNIKQFLESLEAANINKPIIPSEAHQ
jgi:hypothetical protein